MWRRLKPTASCSHKVIYISPRKGAWWPLREMFTLDGAPSLRLPLINLFFLRNWVNDSHHKAGLLNFVCVVCNFSKIRSVCKQCDMASCELLLWRTAMFTYSHSSFFMNSHFRMRLPTHWYLRVKCVCMSASIPPSDGNIYKYVLLASKCLYSISCIAAFLQEIISAVNYRVNPHVLL